MGPMGPRPIKENMGPLGPFGADMLPNRLRKGSLGPGPRGQGLGPVDQGPGPETNGPGPRAHNGP